MKQVFVSQNRDAPSGAIKVCQVGYLTGEAKLAMLTAAPTGEVIVRHAIDNRRVASPQVGSPRFDQDSGDTIRIVDISAVTEPGRYYLEVPGLGRSFEFEIGDDIFARPFQRAMMFFTGQRCGTAVHLSGEFADYHHPACHTADSEFHTSTGRKGRHSLNGGWHDAGDFGRYVVNSGVSTGTLLWAYELNADKLRDVRLDIPESGGQLPDTLAEIRWNLDWMLEMQDESGGVWHKQTTAKFPGSIMPQEDQSSMLIIGNGEAPFMTTQATADLVAVTAIASRVYREYDPDYADRCLAAAERGWAWLSTTLDNHFRGNPPGVATGAYEDDDARDERLWAAAELFRTTGDAAYNDYFLDHYASLQPMFNAGFPQEWKKVQHLAMYAYALTRQDTADATVQAVIAKEALRAADEIVERISISGYRNPLTTGNYIWGSNALVANYAMMLRLANRLSPKTEYVHAAQDCLHYLLGRNSFNTSYVTHVGSRWPMNPHHRTSEADHVEQPWPGMLIGGPNAQDSKESRPPARQWNDVKENFTTNEVAINWNAPLVFLLAESLPAAPESPSEFDITLNTSDEALWIIDTVHLGTKQVKIDHHAQEDAAVITPTWSVSDRQSSDVGVQNIEHGRLHLYQLIEARDCTESESTFEISLPQEYIDEGKLELVFALQAGAKGDYLFNGRTFTMHDFAGNGGTYKKLIVRAADYHEPSEKLRAIERVSFILERKGSVISAPIKIRHIAIDLNRENITPPAEDVRVKNPKSYYEFNYTTQAAIEGLAARVSNESMDITRQLTSDQDGVALIPQWKTGQIPEGHTGNVVLVQSLGAPHHFDPFEVQYVLNIPKPYFDEGKLALSLFVQAGEAGYYRWSGVQRPLASFADKAGQDVVLTITEEDFRTQGKKRNQIEMIGLQLDRNGSTVTEPIILQRITVNLPEESSGDSREEAPEKPTVSQKNAVQPTSFLWSSDCSSESSFVHSTHPVIPGHYEYVADPTGNGIVFRGQLTEGLKIDDPESVHLHPDIYFDTFQPGSFSVRFDVWVDDLDPDVLGPYRDNPWLNVLTVFDRTNWTGDRRFEPSVMTNLVGSPGAYFLQSYSMSPEHGGTFFDRETDAPSFPIKQWVSVIVVVDVQKALVFTYQNGVLVSKGPYRSRPGIAGAHMGLYSNRLMKTATVYNRSCEITVGPMLGSSATQEDKGELLNNGNFANGVSAWQVNQVGNATSEVEVVREGPRGESALRMRVLTPSELSWHLQMFQPGLIIKKDESYVLTFWAKSNRDGNFKVNCMQNHEPWEHSTEKEISVTSDWKQVEFTFRGPWDDNNARVTFTDLCTEVGRIYWFANCSLKLQDVKN